MLEEVFEALVCLFGCAEASVLTHCPQSCAVHGWINAASVRVFAWKAQITEILEVWNVGWCVGSVYGDVGACLEGFLSFRELVEAFNNSLFLPLLFAVLDFVYGQCGWHLCI